MLLIRNGGRNRLEDYNGEIQAKSVWKQVRYKTKKAAKKRRSNEKSAEQLGRENKLQAAQKSSRCEVQHISCALKPLKYICFDLSRGTSASCQQPANNRCRTQCIWKMIYDCRQWKVEIIAQMHCHLWKCTGGVRELSVFVLKFFFCLATNNVYRNFSLSLALNVC